MKTTQVSSASSWMGRAGCARGVFANWRLLHQPQPLGCTLGFIQRVTSHRLASWKNRYLPPLTNGYEAQPPPIRLGPLALLRDTRERILNDFSRTSRNSDAVRPLAGIIIKVVKARNFDRIGIQGVHQRLRPRVLEAYKVGLRWPDARAFDPHNRVG